MNDAENNLKGHHVHEAGACAAQDWIKCAPDEKAIGDTRDFDRAFAAWELRMFGKTRVGRHIFRAQFGRRTEL